MLTLPKQLIVLICGILVLPGPAIATAWKGSQCIGKDSEQTLASEKGAINRALPSGYRVLAISCGSCLRIVVAPDTFSDNVERLDPGGRILNDWIRVLNHYHPHCGYGMVSVVFTSHGNHHDIEESMIS